MLSSRYFKGSCKVFWFWDKKWAFNIYPKPYFEYWKFHKEFCTCEHDIICRPCTVAKTYNKEQYKVFENCLNLNYLCEIKGKLHGSMFFLLEKKSHFICRIIGEHFHFEHACFFTGNRVLISSKNAYEEWKKLKKKKKLLLICLLF